MPEQRHLPHLEIVVQFLQHGVHFVEPGFVRQVENLDIRMQPSVMQKKRTGTLRLRRTSEYSRLTYSGPPFPT